MNIFKIYLNPLRDSMTLNLIFERNTDRTDGEMGMVEIKFLLLLTKHEYDTNIILFTIFFVIFVLLYQC